MNLNDIKEQYRVFKRDGKVHLYDKEKNSGGRAVYKYLVSATRYKNGYAVDGFKPTNVISKFNDQVKRKIKSYKYDSEYYDQNYVAGLFEEHIIYDYLTELGFQMNLGGFMDIDGYNLYGVDVCGNKTTLLTLCIDGLRVLDEVKPTVRIDAYGSGTSWMGGECKREVEAIKEQINSLVKPYLLHDSVERFKAQDVVPFGKGEINLIDMKSMFNITSTDYKTELKNKLIELANTL